MGPRRVPPSPTCWLPLPRPRPPHSRRRRPWPCRRPRPWPCCRPATWHTPEARASQVQAAQMLPSSPVCGHKSQRQTRGKSGNHPPRNSNQVQLWPPSDGLHDSVGHGLLTCRGGRREKERTSHAPQAPPASLPASYLQHVSFLTLSVTQRTVSPSPVALLCVVGQCAYVCMCVRVCVPCAIIQLASEVLFSHVKTCHACPMAAAPVLYRLCGS